MRYENAAVTTHNPMEKILGELGKSRYRASAEPRRINS
jgi:hypothetical protein